MTSIENAEGAFDETDTAQGQVGGDDCTQTAKPNQTVRRLILYSLGALAVGVLVYFGWFREVHLGFDADRTELIRMVGEGKYKQAREFLDGMDERYKDDLRIPLLRGWLEDGTGQLKEAQAAYERALQLCASDEQRLLLHASIADLIFRQGSLPDAEKALERAVSKYGESAATHQLRAEFLIAKGELNSALTEVAKLAEENSVTPHAQRLRRRVEGLMEAAAEPSKPTDQIAERASGDETPLSKGREDK